MNGPADRPDDRPDRSGGRWLPRAREAARRHLPGGEEPAGAAPDRAAPTVPSDPAPTVPSDPAPTVPSDPAPGAAQPGEPAAATPEPAVSTARGRWLPAATPRSEEVHSAPPRDPRRWAPPAVGRTAPEAPGAPGADAPRDPAPAAPAPAAPTSRGGTSRFAPPARATPAPTGDHRDAVAPEDANPWVIPGLR